MSHSIFLWAALGSGLAIASSCAGPFTPFGAVNHLNKLQSAGDFEGSTPNIVSLDVPFDTFTPAQHFANEPAQIDLTGPNARISFFPDRQVVHRAANLAIVLSSKTQIQLPLRLRIFYNELDVTEALLANGKFNHSTDMKAVTITFPRLPLPSDSFQSIRVFFQPGPDAKTVARSYAAPTCDLRFSGHLKNFDTFDPPAEYVSFIDQAASEYHINKLLLTGLIAQESGFNPEAVSWAKAIGLTQVATLAEREVAEVHGDWPRHPEITDDAVPIVKSKILAGVINDENEWRLNPFRSVLGGTTYLDRVATYWGLRSNRQLLDAAKITGDQELLKVILASYHSGPARVGFGLKTLGSEWLALDTLSEARTYVHKIVSYCYHFSADRTN